MNNQSTIASVAKILFFGMDLGHNCYFSLHTARYETM